MLWVPGSSNTEVTVLMQEEKLLGQNELPASPVAWAAALSFSGLFPWAAEEQGSSSTVWERDGSVIKVSASTAGEFTWPVW